MNDRNSGHHTDVDIQATKAMRDEALVLRARFDDFINKLDTILSNDARDFSRETE